MPWFDVLIPAVGTALLIRADARLVGPYWAFSELLPGVGSIYADLIREQSLYRPAVIRRLLYALIPGIYLGIRYDGRTPIEAGVPSVVGFLLILWPAVFHGLPVVTGFRWLATVYAALAVLFGSIGAVGYEAVEFMQRDAGSLVNYLVTKGVEVAIEFAVIGLAAAILRVAWGALQRSSVTSPDGQPAGIRDWGTTANGDMEAVLPREGNPRPPLGERDVTSTFPPGEDEHEG